MQHNTCTIFLLKQEECNVTIVVAANAITKFLGFGGLCRRNYHRELKPQEVSKQNH